MPLDPTKPKGTVVHQGVFDVEYHISIGHYDTQKQLEAETLEIMQTVLREAGERYKELVNARWPNNTIMQAAVTHTHGGPNHAKPYQLPRITA